jgi:ABC-type branched-subunit amino acid transport system substrate-binding protein
MVVSRKGVSTFLLILALILTGCSGGQQQLPPEQAAIFSQTSPPEAENLWKQADQAYKAGKIPNAINLWEKIVQKFPNTPMAAKSVNRIGEIYLSQGQPERAEQYFEWLLYAYPKWDGIALTKLNLMRVQAQTGKKKQVMKDAVALWESSPDPEVRLGLAELMVGIYSGENDLETAFDWSTSGFSVASTPEQKTTLTKATSEYLSRADEGLIRKLYKKKPSDFMRVFLDFRSAQIETQKGQGEMATQRLKTVLAQNPGHPLIPEIQASLRGSKVAESQIPLNADRIGVLVPLNGTNAKYGEMVVRSLNMAVSDWSEAHANQKLSLVVKDSGSDDATAQQSFDELVKKEGVLAVIGPLGPGANKAVSPLANQDGIPLLSMTQKEDESQDNTFVLHVFIDSRDLVRTLVHYCREKLKFERFACLYPADRYGEKLAKVFSEVVQEQGGNMIANVSYTEKSTDFNDPLQKLMNIAKKNAPLSATEGTPFEALFIPDQVQSVSLIAPQLPYNNIVGTALLGTNLWSEAPLVQAGGVYVEQALFATSFYPESRNPRVKAFVEKFESLYNATPSYLEAQAYDALTMLLHARSTVQGGQVDRSTVFQNLSREKDFKGVAGTYNISPKGDIERQYTILQVTNGQLTQVYP